MSEGMEPYTGEERRHGVALRYITPEELAEWRAGTLQLTKEVEKLADTLSGMASHEDVAAVKKVTLRRVYVIIGALVLVVLTLGGGAAATAAVFQAQQSSFADKLATSCEIRNSADEQRRAQSAVAFATLLKSLDDENLKAALEEFAESSPAPPQPNCDKLRD